MIYKVTARLKAASAGAFRRKLLDGTIGEQKPDGREIVAAMNRAVVMAGGDIQWSETCYCDPPLAHERQTVLDHHFDDITTQVIDAQQQYDGRPFMDYLTELADASGE